MDQIDVLILSELSKDARQPFSKIAKKIGVATQTVIRRYHSMKKKQIIYASIRVDTKKLGYVGVAYLFIKTSSGTRVSETVNLLRQTRGVYLVSSSLGDFEAYAELMFKSFNDLSEKITAIKKYPSIQKISFALSNNEHSLLPPKFDLFT
ncbi:MAG: AsnC family transcriptional regulator [Candidatus Bathyarchaeota archaeon]|nr:MAG: AsnC family transcriptional regulator [Candidatus Bathyarchaeum tardum]WNZ29593.1 MAG: AsnC family transcriptional regulator [Candidatus Bathyarchaeota archaeon]